MDRPPPRVYADTSVYGGLFDDEFRGWSEAFFGAVRSGQFVLVASPVVQTELANAPDHISGPAFELMSLAEIASITQDAVDLRDAYLAHGVVGPKGDLDALHVALATVAGCAFLVSWNFKHLVNYMRVPRYGAVNRLLGHEAIGIHSPLEVMGDEAEDA